MSAEGVAFKRHKDTLAYFNKNYVASEIFPRTMGRLIVQAEEIRHASDYDPFYIASKDGTQKQIETAKNLLDYAKRYIMKQKEAEKL
ncbi:MAG: HEPN domain-containing protein [Lachnospiraceae bacterium]